MLMNEPDGFVSYCSLEFCLETGNLETCHLLGKNRNAKQMASFQIQTKLPLCHMPPAAKG